jgi:hypothetical protein
MAMRKFPYGYVMERGVITVKDSEAENVRWIFENRAAGRSNWEMARKLYEGTDPYFKDDVKKTACKISMILYDERYIGADGYEPIVDTELFETVAGKRGKQWTDNRRQFTVGGRTEFIRIEKPKATTYIPSRAVFEKEKALKAMFRENTDAEHIRTAILDLASEKYDCIQ